MGAVLIVHLPLFTFTFLPPISSVFFVEPHLAYENCTLHVFHGCLYIAISVFHRLSGFRNSIFLSSLVTPTAHRAYNRCTYTGLPSLQE
ncbi:hypothetical protein EV401DRAFT_1984777 [Pisolithus croceorrhizus]|nr:hypothetical protein EV401DRAFT_1984777 [Pisolithus croceorrhizus]